MPATSDGSETQVTLPTRARGLVMANRSGPVQEGAAPFLWGLGGAVVLIKWVGDTDGVQNVTGWG